MRKFEFVSYDGLYPLKCFGKLILKIDGKIVDWNQCLALDKKEKWKFSNDFLNSTDLNFTKSELKRIYKILNENIEPGCCHGCY